MINGTQQTLNFPAPFVLCLDSIEQFIALSDAVTRHNYDTDAPDAAASMYNAFMTSLSYQSSPPCLSEDCNEDTLTDDTVSFLDGVVTSFQEGGAISAIGYVIDAAGRIIINTALRYVAITVIGAAAGAVVTMLVGGTAAGVATVAAGEIVELIFDTGLDGVNAAAVEFLIDAAA